MFKQSAYINAIVEQRKIKIHEDMVARYQEALFERPKELVLPLVALGTLADMQKVYDLLDISSKQLLHSRESIECIELPKAGDEIELSTLIGDLYEQQASGNPMGFAVVNIIGKKKGTFIFCISRVFAVRGGFPRC